MEYKWYRSWPRKLPNHLQDRPRIVDNLPRILMDHQDYATVKEWPDDMPGFCMLEWDVALDRQGMERMEREVKNDPETCLFAQYHLSDDRLIQGFGCVYFPLEVIENYRSCNLPGARFTDGVFLPWYMRNYGTLRLVRGVHPQHLNTGY